MRHRLVLILISFFVFGLVLGAANSNAGSDPKFTLLVSQSLIDNRTIRLDAYQDDLLLNQPVQAHVKDGVVIELNDHLYNYFPAGPSILSLPVVAAVRMAGMDMRLIEDNFVLQRILSGLATVLMVWIVYGISCCFIDEPYDLIIAAVSVLGTTIISSMGTALWTLNFSTVIIGLCVLLLARYETGKTSSIRPILLGALLFLAFFARASSVAFIVAALGYLLIKSRRQFLVTAASSLILLLIFLAMSRLEFGTWLPTYYTIDRIQAEREPLWLGMLGNLISPSRGIFIFSPFFLLLIPGAVLFGRRLHRQPLLWMAAVWFLLSLLLTARAASWWGGWSFGPRIMTDSLLALILIGILIWRDAYQLLGTTAKNVIVVLFGILSLAAIFIHSYQGLYNPNTLGWNQFHEPVAIPPFDGLGDVFDWGEPQFLATAQRNCEFGYVRQQELLLYDTTLEEYQWGTTIRHDADQVLNFRLSAILEAEARLNDGPPPSSTQPLSLTRYQLFIPSISKPGNRAIYIGWSPDRSHLNYRLSICPEAQIAFRLGQTEVNGPFETTLLLSAIGEQEFRVFVNGTAVGMYKSSAPLGEPEQFTIPFEGNLLEPGGLNEISLEMPDAKRSRPGEWRLEALVLYQAVVYPLEQAHKWRISPDLTPMPPPYP